MPGLPSLVPDGFQGQAPLFPLPRARLGKVRWAPPADLCEDPTTSLPSFAAQFHFFFF